MIVDPGVHERAPSDAVVLFDGSDLSAWQGRAGDAPWTVEDGVMTVAGGTGDITTRQAFGDVQLHVEWRAPSEVVGESRAPTSRATTGLSRLSLLRCVRPRSI